MTVSLSQAEKALSLADAAKRFPGRPSKDTLRRWISKGLRNGAKLDAFRIGGALYTTEDSIERFLVAQNQDPSAPRRQQAAEIQLKAMGV